MANKKLDAIKLADKLFQNGLETRPLFLGMHQQPIFKEMKFFKNQKFPVTEELSKSGLYLPSGLKLTKKKIKIVCETIKKIFNEKL